MKKLTFTVLSNVLSVLLGGVKISKILSLPFSLMSLQFADSLKKVIYVHKGYWFILRIFSLSFSFLFFTRHENLYFQKENVFLHSTTEFVVFISNVISFFLWY